MASDRSRLISIVQSRQNAQRPGTPCCLRSPPRDVSEVIGIEGEHLLAEALRSQLRLRTVFVRRRLPHDIAAMPASAPSIASPFPPPSPSFDSPLPSLTAPSTPNPRKASPPSLSRPAFPSPRLSPHRIRARSSSPPACRIPATSARWSAPRKPSPPAASSRSPDTVRSGISKALRASAGSAFRVPVIRRKIRLRLRRSRRAQHSHPRRRSRHRDPDAVPCSQAYFTGPPRSSSATKAPAFPPDLSTALPAHRYPHARSRRILNAAVAASILLYEAARQRAV